MSSPPRYSPKQLPKEANRSTRFLYKYQRLASNRFSQQSNVLTLALKSKAEQRLFGGGFFIALKTSRLTLHLRNELKPPNSRLTSKESATSVSIAATLHRTVRRLGHVGNTGKTACAQMATLVRPHAPRVHRILFQIYYSLRTSSKAVRL